MKTILFLASMTLFATFAALLWVDYALFWPIKTLEIKNLSSTDSVQTVNQTYKMGEAVAYELDYCKYTSAPANITRTLVDGQVITLSNTTGYLPVGCKDTTVATAIIPTTMNPGRYYLDVQATYQVNPLRSITIHYHTNYFTITR